EQTEKIIQALKGSDLEQHPLTLGEDILAWQELNDGVYVIQNNGAIANNTNGLALNTNDIVLKLDNSAYVYASNFACKLDYNAQDGTYGSYAYSITQEQLAELLENFDIGGGSETPSGSAPAKHDHPVSDVYIEQVSGGAWDTDLYKLQNVELAEAVKNDEEIMAYIEEKQTTPEEFIENYVQLFEADILTDSNGNSFMPFGLMINKSLLKAKIAPNSSFNDLDFGIVAKIPATFDGEDLSKITLESCNKKIICGVDEHEYQPVAATDINDLFTLLSNGYPDPENQEEVDAWLQKYGGKTLAVSIHPTDENGDDIDYTFSDIMTDDSLYGLAFNYIGFVAPLSDLEELMNAESEEEGMSAVKFHFDEIEEPTVIQVPLADDIAKKIAALTDRDSQFAEQIQQMKNAETAASTAQQRADSAYTKAGD
ncbi:MAG: hypothetical protein VZS12_11725, partial [Ruminococcus bromii]|nr:hypothetical protein [Ruminococcus bromii]